MRYQLLALIILTGLFYLGCSHTSELTGENLQADESDIDYSIVYYIHADSDYLYHTPDGEPIRENSVVLDTAFKVAEEALSGEVFIYYQRAETKFLGLFPRKRSRLYHYKKGQIVNTIKYRHADKKESFLATEAHLLREIRTQNRTDEHQSYFLFFGHEIPPENGKGYHHTLPDIDVNITSFANGIQNFLYSDKDRFNLVVLSTCNNGTPKMAKLLMPFTDTMLASPQNLHLSHFDTDAITLLEKEPNVSSVKLARSMADQTYHRLEETIQTTITLALYDLEDVKPYIDTLASLTSSNQTSDRFVQFQDNVDCSVINPFEADAYQQGVEIWYKPARFGRQSGRSTHSGWGCKPAAE
jgi:hypothetical protein